MASAPRFARQLVLPGFGPAGQDRLAAARVVVIGAGGLGCAVLPALAAAGVGSITVVDPDVVEATNLPRQTLYTDADVGRSKAEVAVEALSLLAPDAVLTARVEAFGPRNGLDLLIEADLVIDGSDSVETRYLANEAAEIADIPFVWGAAHRYSGQVGLAWAGHGPTYRDLFPEPPHPDEVETCEIAGILGPVCTVIGGLMAYQLVETMWGYQQPRKPTAPLVQELARLPEKQRSPIVLCHLEGLTHEQAATFRRRYGRCDELKVEGAICDEWKRRRPPVEVTGGRSIL